MNPVSQKDTPSNIPLILEGAGLAVCFQVAVGLPKVNRIARAIMGLGGVAIAPFFGFHCHRHYQNYEHKSHWAYIAPALIYTAWLCFVMVKFPPASGRAQFVAKITWPFYGVWVGTVVTAKPKRSSKPSEKFDGWPNINRAVEQDAAGTRVAIEFIKAQVSLLMVFVERHPRLKALAALKQQNYAFTYKNYKGSDHTHLDPKDPVDQYTLLRLQRQAWERVLKDMQLFVQRQKGVEVLFRKLAEKEHHLVRTQLLSLISTAEPPVLPEMIAAARKYGIAFPKWPTIGFVVRWFSPVQAAPAQLADSWWSAYLF